MAKIQHKGGILTTEGGQSLQVPDDVQFRVIYEEPSNAAREENLYAAADLEPGSGAKYVFVQPCQRARTRWISVGGLVRRGVAERCTLSLRALRQSFSRPLKRPLGGPLHALQLG